MKVFTAPGTLQQRSCGGTGDSVANSGVDVECWNAAVASRVRHAATLGTPR